MAEMRLIDAGRLKEVIDKNFYHTGAAEVIQQIIDKQPTAIVYCKECTLYGHCFTADIFDFTGYDNGFCAAGKKAGE